MNIRMFTIAVMISALPQLGLAAASGVNFNKGDFIAAEKITQEGETVVSVKLSKSGKAKVKKLNKSGVGSAVDSDIAGVKTHLILKAPIEGDGLQVGPYSEVDAQKVVSEINLGK